MLQSALRGSGQGTQVAVNGKRLSAHNRCPQAPAWPSFSPRISPRQITKELKLRMKNDQGAVKMTRVQPVKCFIQDALSEIQEVRGGSHGSAMDPLGRLTVVGVQGLPWTHWAG